MLILSDGSTCGIVASNQSVTDLGSCVPSNNSAYIFCSGPISMFTVPITLVSVMAQNQSLNERKIPFLLGLCKGYSTNLSRMVFIIFKNIPSKMIIHQKSSVNQQEHYPESTIASRSGYGSICHHLLFLIHSCCTIPFLSITVCPRARHGMSPPRVVRFFSLCVCLRERERDKGEQARCWDDGCV